MNKFIRPKSKKKQNIDFSFLFPYLTYIEHKNPFKVEQYKKITINRYQSAAKTHKIVSPKNNRYPSQSKYKQNKQKKDIVNRQSIFFNEQTIANSKQIMTTRRKTSRPHTAKKRPINDGLSIKKQMKISFIEPALALTESCPIRQIEIPGIVFKKSDVKRQSGSADLNNYVSHLHHNRESYIYSSRHSQQQGNWQKNRLQNIESIINRKHQNFNDLIGEYRRRCSLKQNTLLFVFDSKDVWIKKILIKKGWVENPNKESKAYHLLWSYKFPQTMPFPQQIANHYPNNDYVTSKSGLHKMLQKYEISDIQPRTYDLLYQKKQFLKQFAKISLISYLNQLMEYFQFQQNPQIQCEQIDKMEIQQMIKSKIETNDEELSAKLKQMLQQTYHLFIGQELTHQIEYWTSLTYLLKNSTNIESQNQIYIKTIRNVFLHCLQRQKYIINKQTTIQNIWIVKAKNGSKGAGIFLSKDKQQITKHHHHRLVQKYVQNVLILSSAHFRKFDIRVWVLLVGCSNLRMYYNTDFYGRICYDKYQKGNDDLKNQSAHLTNYSLNKDRYRKSPQKQISLPSVLFPDQLFAQVSTTRKINYKQKFYEDLTNILIKMRPLFQKQICIGPNDNYFQIFGFDLLIDSNLQLKLLEVNLSARCEQRHSRLTTMLQQMGEGLLNILEGNQNQIKNWKQI